MIFQITKALSYCHSKNLVHRDLKLNNILLLHHKKDSPIKLIDFGCAIKIKAGEKLSNRIGTVI